MKQFLILLIFVLPLLACGGPAATVSPTNTPLTPPIAATAPQTDSQPIPDTATMPPTQIPVVSADSFPNSNDYEWKLIASGLDRPVDIQPANDGSGRLFVIEKYGAIRMIENGQLLDAPFLDISDRVGSDGNEQGLLGLAFFPNPEQKVFFVNYTDKNGNTVISRFSWNEVADPNSEKQLLHVDQPFPNHNGGVLTFGPDGYLYAGLGDGGAAGDPLGNGQNTNVLLGKILRLDVSDLNSGYTLPADNPFGNEIWAYGLRNPWRISFDKATGDLWIGDVGQSAWEEIDYLPAGSPGGANFGWSIMEGNHGYYGEAQPGLILPAAEYSHSIGACSVTGGYVYRGAMPEWQGIYLYGDYCKGTVWGLILSNGQWQNQVMFETGERITSFGQDEFGEIYFASDGGSIYILSKK